MSRTEILKASDIIEFLGSNCGFVGDPDREITRFSSIFSVEKGDLIFCKKGYENSIVDVRNCTIILSKDTLVKICNNNTYIMVQNPRLEFVRILVKELGEQPVTERFSNRVSLRCPDIHSTAIVECDNFIHPSVVVGPYSCIGSKCSIGGESTIGSQVYIGGRVNIGRNVHIQSQVTIGALGFGLERNDRGGFERFPQIGGVVIEDNVEIGAHANIQKGALEDTIIRKGSKIGPYCNIGHSSEIGIHTFTGGGCNFGGSSKVGDFSWIGMGTVVFNNVKIGSNVTVGGASVVTKDIGDNQLAYGTPAKVVRRMDKLNY